MRLREIPAGVYARDILPLTAPIWAGGRSFDEYVAQTLAIAHSDYGGRHYRTLGLYDGPTCVASFKRYERTIMQNSDRMRAFGLGAVFTPPNLRGRGYASVMIAMALDRARAQGYALAFLFSDIRPQFYASLGFRELPSRRFTLHADALPSTRLELTSLTGAERSGVRRLFELTAGRASTGFARNAQVWNWIELRMQQVSQRTDIAQANLAAWRRGRIAAYVLGTRQPQKDAYVLREFGYADGADELVAPLLRAAAGDMRQLIGWLPPHGDRDRLIRPNVRKRSDAVFMIAPLRESGEGLLRSIASDRRSDFCWATDHV